MNRLPRTGLLILGITTTLWAAAEDASYGTLWQRPEGPLLTPWARQVTTTDVLLPEYPRPQMVRLPVHDSVQADAAGPQGPVWINLNGMWDYAICTRGLDWPDTWDGMIRVPFCVESYLSGVQRYVGPGQQLWYRRTIQSPEYAKDQRVLLHFGAVDWAAVVYLNGEDVDSHKGGYDPFVMDITDHLQDGDNELVVSVWDPTDEGLQPHGKQKNQPGNGFYTPVTGIWQTVWLEVVPQTYLEHMELTPDVDNQQLLVRLDICNLKELDGIGLKAFAQDKEIAAIGLQPELPAPPDKPKSLLGVSPPAPEPDAAVVEPSLDNRIEIVSTTGKAQAFFKLPIEAPILWSPDKPHLYDLYVEIKRGNKVIDLVKSYFGMRKIEVKEDPTGYSRIFLNNEVLFPYGPLDAGWWPDGLYTAPTDEALRYDIEVTKQLGFNLIRKHVKVEPARWYYWCDKRGILVWQDMPNARGAAVASSDGDLKVSPEQEAVFRNEWQAIIKARFHHPCIVVWVPFDEGQGQFKTNEIQRWTRMLDRSRLVDGPSGWHDRGEGDMFDVHYDQGPALPLPQPGRVSVLGACGGLRYTLQGHLWKEDPQRRRRPRSAIATQEILFERYERFVNDVQLLVGKGLGGAVLRQLTDSETSADGLMTYDRAVVKYQTDIIQRLHRSLYQLPPFYRVVLPSAEQAAVQDWRYTKRVPVGKWMQPGFDDASWSQGAAGFGNKGQYHNQYVLTSWTTADIWLRRPFALAAIPEGELVLNARIDDKAEIYINGLLVDTAEDIKDMYRFRHVDSALRKALRIGENLLAVHAHNANGRQDDTQFIDVGIMEIVR